MKKQHLLIGAIILVLLILGGGVFAFTQLRSESNDQPPVETDEKPTKKREQLNQIPVEERPYVTIAPVGSRNLDLTVHTVKKDATSVEYELEYQAGTLLQGAFGKLDLGPVPITEDVLLGSCSAGGSCTYHEDVRGGTMLLRFDGGESRYALKQDWKYLPATRETQIASEDSKFQLEADGLASAGVIVLYNTPGYPEGLEGTPVSDPYSLQASGTLSGTGSLTMRAAEEGDLKIMGWDGEAWQEFTGEVDGKSITAEVDLLELYIVVQ